MSGEKEEVRSHLTKDRSTGKTASRIADGDAECEKCGDTDGPFTADAVTGEVICKDCAKRGAEVLGG